MQTPESLSDLAAFVAVIDAGSFTLASGRLGLSKSMVSKCVSRLEASMGSRLIQRTTRRLRLTETGTALYESCSPALAAIDEARLAVSKLQGEARGLLRVGASPALGTIVLPHVVSRLRRAHPDLSIELLLEDRHVDLVREGVDVALRVTGDPPDSALVYRRLGPNRQVVCASPAYLKEHGVPKTPQDLKSHDCVAHTQRATPRLWQFTTRNGARTSVQIDPRVLVTSSLALRSCALEGLGIVEVNSYIVGADIAAGRLVRLLDGYQPRELSIFAVFPARKFLAPKVRAFVDAMLSIMTPEPYWDRYRTPAGRAGRGP
jgi:DNA-binding transcriptional LysR family regulator